MITVTSFRNEKLVYGFKVTGHAGCGEYGEDLICAAVSAIVQTAVLGITDVLHLKADCSIKDGKTICILDRETRMDDRIKAELIFQTMLTGLESIRLSNPEALKFKSKED